MTVAELRELLARFPQDAEVWLLEGTYGTPNTKYADYWPEMHGKKLVLGYDGSGGGDVD